MEDGIMLVLNLIGTEPEEPTAGQAPRPGAIVDKCKNSWSWFKQYIQDADKYVAAHILAMVRSHYPGVDLRRLEAGVSTNTDQEKAEQLRATSQATTTKIIIDVDLFGETGVGSMP
jgi:hypothetical protein